MSGLQRALVVQTRSAEETRIVGASLAPVLLPGDIISLSGDLGAGKTVFVQGLAAALGVHERVTSPTFTIVHEYSGRYPILHLDVYRLNNFQEVLDLGFEEFLDPHSIVAIEWGEAISPLLPRRHLDIDMRRADGGAEDSEDEVRKILFKPHGPEWVRKVQAMRTTAETLLGAVTDDPAGGGARFEVTTEPTARDDMGDRPGDEAGES
jgi:tRNA threonylcarbamoyladenosine biosynthesis protein TsaE